MMAEHESEEAKLRAELENISLDYRNLVGKSREMAPKDVNTKKIDPNGDAADDDDEFEEIAEVADDLNSLESALDEIEERADRIRAQLLELLNSNREIRQSMQAERNKLEQAAANGENPDGNPDGEQSSN